MRLKLLVIILNVIIVFSAIVTTYNLGYDSGYEHGVVAGYWRFDYPPRMQEIERRLNENRNK
jgi:hypothetical protein